MHKPTLSVWDLHVIISSVRVDLSQIVHLGGLVRDRAAAVGSHMIVDTRVAEHIPRGYHRVVGALLPTDRTEGRIGGWR